METTIGVRPGAASNLIDDSRLLLAALVAAVAIAVAAAAVSLAPGLSSGPISGPADPGYTQAEQVRANVFAFGSSDVYTGVESLRGGAFGSGAAASSSDDGSYDSVESTRSQLTLPAGAEDRSYDHVEQIRGQLGR